MVFNVILLLFVNHSKDNDRADPKTRDDMTLNHDELVGAKSENKENGVIKEKLETIILIRASNTRGLVSKDERETLGIQLNSKGATKLISRWAHDAIITSLWRRNDVATSFWRHIDVIIVLCDHWETLHPGWRSVHSNHPQFLWLRSIRAHVISVWDQRDRHQQSKCKLNTLRPSISSAQNSNKQN